MKKSLPVLLTGAAGKAKGYFTKKNTDLVNVLKPAVFVILWLTLTIPGKLFAQAPTISYSSPQTYFVGKAIPPLTPVASKVTKNISYTPFQEFGDANYGNLSINDMVADGAGNIYVADLNRGILKISANGATLDTLATFARPAEALHVAIDSIGNVYAGVINGIIYKIPAGGGPPVAITPASTTIFSMRADAAGNVFYLSGTSFTATSIVKIPAGGGPPVTVASGTYPGYNQQYSMAVDANDNIYVRDSNYVIAKIPAGGGSPVELTTTASRIGATGLAVDAIGNVYYASSIGSGNPPKSFIGFIEAATGQNKVICNNIQFLSQMAVDGAGDAFSLEYALSVTHPLGGYFLSKPLPAGLSFDQATGTISGTPTAASPATDYIITGYNASGGTHATVNIGVITSILNDALLTSLTTTPAAPLKQVTGPDYADYTTAVPYKTTSITVTPVTQNPAATVKVNGVAVASGTASASIPLSVGSNVINTVVTAADGATVKTYSITVTRRANSALAKLLLSTGSTLTTTTGPANANYAASVPAATTSLTVTPVTEDPAATVTVNGVAVTSGTPSQVISLTGSPTIINLVVTASDGFMTTYSIAVSKNGSSDAFLTRFLLSTGSSLTAAASGPAEANYTASVTAGTASLTITPITGDPGASVTINGTPVTSGTASGAISLTTDPTVISAVVTAADGTILTYSISVSKDGSGDAFLSRLLLSTGSLLTPTLGDGNANYSASVDPSTTSLMITPVTRDPAATVTVDGTAVTSGTASAPIGLVVGDNLVTIVVTAPSGNTLTYTVDVNRPVEPDNTVYQPISVEKPANSPQFDDDMIGVHQGLSPNGDGINDFLVIDGILAYPDNRLAIMNRNGTLIYEAEGYDNSTKVFDGHSNKTGQMQLPGTYFYTLDYTVKGITKHKTGFIVLKY